MAIAQFCQKKQFKVLKDDHPKCLAGEQLKFFFLHSDSGVMIINFLWPNPESILPTAKLPNAPGILDPKLCALNRQIKIRFTKISHQTYLAPFPGLADDALAFALALDLAEALGVSVSC